MIELKTLNRKNIILNCEHIEKIESIPETIITLTNGKTYLVQDSPSEVVEKVIEYKNKIFKANY